MPRLHLNDYRNAVHLAEIAYCVASRPQDRVIDGDSDLLIFQRDGGVEGRWGRPCDFMVSLAHHKRANCADVFRHEYITQFERSMRDSLASRHDLTVEKMARLAYKSAYDSACESLSAGGTGMFPTVDIARVHVGTRKDDRDIEVFHHGPLLQSALDAYAQWSQSSRSGDDVGYKALFAWYEALMRQPVSINVTVAHFYGLGRSLTLPAYVSPRSTATIALDEEAVCQLDRWCNEARSPTHFVFNEDHSKLLEQADGLTMRTYKGYVLDGKTVYDLPQAHSRMWSWEHVELGTTALEQQLDDIER